MILHSPLYSRAKIRGEALEDHVLCSEKGVDAIVDIVYKMNPLSVGIAAYSDYVKLLYTRRSPSETYATYEDRFSAALKNLNSIGESVSIPATLAASSLIHNSNIDLSQQLGVMSAAMSSVGLAELTRKSEKDAFPSTIKYETVAAVVCQYDNNASETTMQTNTLSSMADRPSDPRKSNRSRKM